MNFQFLLLIFLSLAMLYTTGQTRSEIPLSGAFDCSSRREYFSGQLDFGTVTFRDFATSPLFYNGPGLRFATTALSRSGRKDELLDLRFGFFSTYASVPKSNVLQAGGISLLGSLQLYYHYLFTLKKLSGEKILYKTGPALVTTQNIRVNEGLFNNALGLENITNLMLAAQMVSDISRLRDRKINLYLFSVTLPARRRELCVQVNTGILNCNYRPGYAYAYDGEIIGTETDPLSWFLQNYRWAINGWRLQTRLEWLWYLHNGNAFSVLYQWDAAHAPGRHEAFQMAMHQIGFSYYFERSIKKL